MTLPGRSLIKKELAFDLSRPGALGPVSFSGSTIASSREVSLNAARKVSFTPSTRRTRESLIISEKLADTWIAVNVINNAKEDIELSWYREGVNYFIRVPSGSNRHLEERFYEGQGEHPIAFTAHSYLRGRSFKVMLNSTVSRSIVPSSKKITRTLVAGDRLQSLIVNFINEAKGPVVISWLDNIEEKMIFLEKGETIQKHISLIGRDRTNPVVFTAKRKDTNGDVRLNGHITAAFLPSGEANKEKIVATDDLRYVVVEFENRAFAEVEIFWQERGLRKSFTLDPKRRKTLELSILGSDALKPVIFTGALKAYRDEVELNSQETFEVIPLMDKVKNFAVARDLPKYGVFAFKNEADGPVDFIITYNGAKTKRKMVGRGSIDRFELQLNGESAYMPMEVTARLSKLDFPINVNQAPTVKVMPSKEKTPNEIIATEPFEIDQWYDDYWRTAVDDTDMKYLNLEIQNNATDYVEVVLEKGVTKKYIVLKRGQLGKKAFVFRGENNAKPVKIYATTPVIDLIIDLNKKEYLSLTPTIQIKVHKITITSRKPKNGYINTLIENSSHKKITIYWKQGNKTRSVQIGPMEIATKTILYPTKKIGKQIKFQSDYEKGILLNKRENVKITVKKDNTTNYIKATLQKVYIIANFVNNAAVPIVVNWLENGVKKTKEVAVGDTVQKELAFDDGDLKKTVKFTAKRKDNDEVVLLNGASDVSLAVTRDKIAAYVVASNYPMYVVADFVNNAAVPIVVNWLENGVKKSKEVAVGETVQQELAFDDGDLKKTVKFTAKRKDNDEVVLLNGASDVSLAVTRDKIAASVVASNYPMYVVADFVNNAAVPIFVNWLENGVKKSKEVAVGETVQQELAFDDGDLKKTVKFTAKRKDNDEVVLLNGASDVSLAVTRDKIAASVVASNYPMYVVADFVNNAAVPIFVNWLENGVKKSKEVAVGETVQQELAFDDGDLKKTVKFTAKRKDNDEVVLLNGASDVSLAVTRDKIAASVVASNYPMYVVADFVNNAAVPIVVNWLENGVKKSKEVAVGETVQQDLAFDDGDLKKTVKFTAKRKDNDEVALLNGASHVSLAVTRDKIAASVVASNYPMYVVADFVNNAAVPIVVNWLENGVKKSKEVAFGETVQQELAFDDGDLKKTVKFTAKRKDNDEVVLLNGASHVSLAVTRDKIAASVVASNYPMYVVADFVNNAAVPIVVNWLENGVKKSKEVAFRETVQQELAFDDGDLKKTVKFTAKRKDNDEVVLLNGASDVSLAVTRDKIAASVVASNYPMYVVADFVNNAAVPIFVNWLENGVKKTKEVAVGDTVQQELAFDDGDLKKTVKFTAKRKDNDEVVLLNGASDVSLAVTRDKIAAYVVASNYPMYVVADFVNNAAVPIVVNWLENGVKKSKEVAVGETVQQELAFDDGDLKKTVKFTAKRKDNDEVVLLNGASDVPLAVTRDNIAASVVASNYPMYVVADFVNNAAVPIFVNRLENGVKKSKEVAVGETVQQELAFDDGDLKKTVKFTAKRKDNDEVVLLNGASDVSLAVTRDKIAASVVASNYPMYVVADFVNNAAVPIVVNWLENGVKKSKEVAVGETVQQELAFDDGDLKKTVKFTAKRKDNDEVVLLNGARDVSLAVTRDKIAASVVASNYPMYVVADFVNNAAVPIVVNWLENGVKKSKEVAVGETVQQDLAFDDGDLKKTVKFTAKRKDNDEVALLNGASHVSLAVTRDKIAASVVASNYPMYVVADFVNNAAVPIVVNWLENGVKKSKEVAFGETVQQELAFDDGDLKKTIKFTAKRKDNDEVVLLNGASHVSLAVTRDKIAASVVASNYPMYVVADFVNNAAVPIFVNWLENGVKKSKEVAVGETVQQELAFDDGDLKKTVKFTAKRKDNDEVVLLNGASDVSLAVTRDKIAASVVASNYPMYVVADFVNNAAVPIVVNWLENGVKKSKEVAVGETVQQDLAFDDGDLKKTVKFTAKRKDNDEVALLNGASHVSLAVTRDKIAASVVASNYPMYVVADFVNNAAVPIVVNWLENGVKKSKEVAVGETVQQELAFDDGHLKKTVKFTAKRKDNDEVVLLNGASHVSLAVTRDKIAASVVASNYPMYVVADFVNNAAVPIVVNWLENGVKKSKEVAFGETVQQELAFDDGDLKKTVKFTAKRKDNDEVVLLNGASDVSLAVTRDKIASSVVASNYPMYVVADFVNNAAVPIVVNWLENGVKKSKEVAVGETVQQELAFDDGDLKKTVKFTAKRKDNDEVVLLNGASDVSLAVTRDKIAASVVASNYPMYVVADFVNNAAVPIVVNWLENGVKKSKEVAVGETVQQELAFDDGDLKKTVKFTAKRKDNDEVVLLNGASDVSLAVTRDKIAASVVASNYPMYVVADFVNNAAVPIVVNWLEKGVKKSKEVAVGETVQQELAFDDGDLKKTVKFTAKRKDNDEVVLLNGASDVPLAVTRDKIAASVVASNYPMYVVADFVNNAAVPIVVNWLENGVKKSKEVAVGETVQQELAFDDGDLKKTVKFTAKRKDNDEVVLLNGSSDVSLAVTRDKIAASVVASNYPMYVVADFVNNAAVPIVVNWLENGVKKSKEVAVGETVQQELAFDDGDLKKTVKFTAKRKDNDEVVLLNGASDVSLAVTRDKIAASVVASNYPMYVVADFVNNAAVPIVVNWLENGVKKSKEVAVGETVQQELAFDDGDLKKTVKFTAKRKDNDEVVLLNGASHVSLAVTRDKIAASVVASNYPMYVVADFVNNAAVPIVVNWLENGVKKSKEVAVGETVQQELAFDDGDLKKTVKFTAKRKDNDEVVLLNGASDVSLAVTRDKIAASVVASNYPMYVVADFVNNAAVPIVVNWLENGVKKSKEVAVGETVQQDLAFDDGDLKKTVKFTAKRKDNDEVALLNGASHVSLAVTRDKIAASVVASNYPMYVVADFVNNAAVPIVVNWLENGVKKSKEVAVGETVQQELAFDDGDLKKTVKFTAKRKDNDEVVLLNGASHVSLAVTRDKIAASVVASNYPMYVVADFVNNAAVPIVVNWLENGVKKSKEVAFGETVQQELAFDDGDLKKTVKFTAKRKDNDEVVLLNGASDVSLAVTRDKIASSVVASNYPMYVVADFVNNAAVPIVVNWLENGVKKSKEVAVGETVQQELAFDDGDLKKTVKFTAKRKDNDEVVLLNGASDVSLAVTRDKIAASVVASNYPMYVVADFVNNAAVPIVVNWLENGVKKSKEVAVGETVQQELAFDDGDLKKTVKFTAKRKDNDEVVLLNGASDVSLAVTRDKIAASVVASNYPMYVVADFVNNAAVPIVVNWLEKGVKKSKEVAVGETVQQQLAFDDGDLKKTVKFTAKRKDNDEVVLLNGASDVPLSVTRDKIAASVVASNYPMYVVADFVNNAAVPIVVNWLENGVKKSKEVAVGETVQQELAFDDGDLKKTVKFTAKRKDNDEVVLLNGSSDVSLAVTRDKIAASVVASNYPMYVVADFVNNAAVPIVVNWLENGVKKSKEVAVGETVQQELAFDDGDLKKTVKFTAKRKDNDEVVLLNGASHVSLAVTRDKIAASVVASNYPMYVVADFVNKAAVPIVVNWLENGVKKSKEVAVGETVQQELAFDDGDLKKTVKFTAKRKDNDEVVLLNGASDVPLAVTRDNIAASVVASNYPMYVVADFVNNAAVPIVVNWLENGVKKSKEVAVGETVQQELAFDDGDLKKTVKFTAKRKDNDEVVLLNGASDVSLAVTRDKIAASVVASNYPMYVVADFVNNAAVPIVVNWLENGVKKSKEVAAGETVQQELAFDDGDLKKTVKFTAKRKDNDEVVLLNGASDVSLAVTRDKIAGSVVASNYPMYVVADFVNNAAVPIVVNWLENGVKKSKEVAVGDTVQQELAFDDGDLKKTVKFTVKRKDNDEVVLLNGASDVSLAVTRDKIASSVVASNYPMYVVADFVNNAAVPIVVNWLENGVKKSKEVAVGETVQQELAFEDGDLKKTVKFTAKRKDNDEVVLLNGASDVSLAVTRDKIAASVVASNYPMYVVADFVNNAAVPIVVNWLENGVKKSKEVAVGDTVQQELAFDDGDLKKTVKFTVKRKDNDEVVLLNGASDVSLAVTRDKIASSVVASNYPMYVVADFVNNAAVPIVVNWLENGVKKSKEVAVGETVQQELAFEDGDLKKTVKFTAKRKDNDEVVLLNGASDVSLAVTRDKIAASVVASNYPMYVVADFVNNAAVPIVVNWLENGVKKSKEVAVGETVQQELAFDDGDLKKTVKFTAKRKDNDEVVLLNGASHVSLAVTRDKIAASVVASNYPMYVVADFVNNAAVPIVVNWLENGVKKSKEVAVGETVQQELAFDDGDLKKTVKFTAKRKDNDEVVLLNGASDVSLAVTRDKIAASVVASNYPMYVVADFVNNAAVPIVVNWLENGVKKSKEVAVGETVQQEVAFEDGDLKKTVKFTAKRKDNDEVVLLNGASDVSLAVKRDKIAASVVASNYPMYVVADFVNNAAVPIVVNWLEDGVKKSKEVAVGETVQQELAFDDGDLKKTVKFTAKRKDNDEVVLLNGASDVSLAVTRDKIAASVVASNYPMYVVADFVNNAAVPI